MSNLYSKVPGGSDNKSIYIFKIGDKPVAGYTGCNGEYDGYQDFVLGLQGSGLADVIGAQTYEEFMDNVVPSLMESGWAPPIFIDVEGDYTVSDAVGLSVNMIWHAVWEDCMQHLQEYLDYPAEHSRRQRAELAKAALHSALKMWEPSDD